MAVFLTTPLSAAEKEGRRKNQEAADGLFTNSTLHILKITIPEAGLSSLRQNPRSYVSATLQEGSSRWTNVQIRLKGGYGSFRQLDDKPGLTLSMAGGSPPFHGLKKFHLNNSVQDPTYLSEWLCSGVYREAGVPAARVAHAVVELNGHRWGLYLIMESLNSDFLARYFKRTDGNLYGQGPNADINAPLWRMGGQETEKWRELQALTAAASDGDMERLRTRLPQRLDLPRFLSLMAVDVILDNWDGYTFNVKNYEVYHDLDTDRVVFMPHDLDQLFRNTDAPIMPGARGLVAQAVLREPHFRAAYRQRFLEVVTNCFVAPILAQRLDSKLTRLTPELKLYDPGLAAELVNGSGDLKRRISARAKSLAAQLAAEEVRRQAATNRPAASPKPAQ